jgi:succinate dehydrogenase/fumarate reductase-like Fe-S protein
MSLRIDSRVTPPVRFHFDGVPVDAYEGESIAAALLAAGVTTLRRAPADGAPRGAFCWMGICQECVVRIDGVAVEACRMAVVEGLSVRSA